MWLLRERLMVALYIHSKNSNHLWSHSRAIMALHDSRLGLENKSGRIFCVQQVYFTKSCQPFILFKHRIWGETVLFIILTSDRMQYLTIFQDLIHSVNIQDDQSWAFSETVQKISKITYTAGQPVLTLDRRQKCELWSSVWMSINRVTLQHN